MFLSKRRFDDLKWSLLPKNAFSFARGLVSFEERDGCSGDGHYHHTTDLQHTCTSGKHAWQQTQKKTEKET